MRRWIQSFMQHVICPECNGTRLKKEALYFIIHDKNIAQLADMDIIQLSEWFMSVEKKLSARQVKIGLSY